MPKFLKIVRYISYASFALLIPGAAILLILLHSTTAQHHLEKTLSATFEMEILISQPLQISFLHGLQIALRDVHVRKAEADIASAREIVIGIDLLPLLYGDVRVNGIEVQDPVVTAVRYPDGNFNFTQPQPHVTLKLARIRISNATVHFDDMLDVADYSATSCNLDLIGLTPMDRARLVDISMLDISANLGCTQVRRNDFTVDNLQLALTGANQVFNFKPVTMDLLGARGTGALLADLSGTQPQYELRYDLPQFRLEEAFPMLTPPHSITGAMDFSTRLSMQGKTLSELKQTLAGQVSLQGKDLLINGSNLDEQLARYESSQHFDLVDAGAVLFAGPLALVVTRGFDLASIFLDAGASSPVPAVISQWQIANGVAQATDVAMTTHENLIALKGGLDLPNARFKDLNVALLDKRGCVRVMQAVNGSFQQPEIDRPKALKALVGPLLNLLKKLEHDDCAVFYSGTLAPQP